MIKKNFKTLIITSIIILLPIIAGLLLWKQLPAKMPSHWGVTGEIDGYAEKEIVVFLVPMIMLLIQWLCAFITGLDPKAENITDKSMNLILWIIPCINLTVNTIMYLTALNIPVPVNIILSAVCGIMFIIIGSHLPQCKQTYTIGIKVPWTLNDEDNWNKTHRLAGKLWVIGGLLILATSFLETIFIFLGITLLITIIPVVYSYLLFKNSKE